MTDRTLRVLSIDGGGVRAHLAALVLADLEHRAGRLATELFDLVVGTSTGGVIGMGVAVGIPAAELADFFPRCGERIFAQGKGWGGLEQKLDQSSKSLGALLGGAAGGPRHRPDGLVAVLRDVFGDARLAQVALPLAVTAFDRATSAPVVLASRDAVIDPDFDLPLVDVARATTAAAQVFPPLLTRWAGAEHSFSDGGVWANNPAGVALSEAVAASSIGPVMVSLGTGAAPGTSMAELNRTWLGRADDPATMAGTVWSGEVLARRALPPSRFHRFQVVDRRVAGAMDDASPARLAALSSAAADFVSARAAELDSAAAMLTVGTGQKPSPTRATAAGWYESGTVPNAYLS